MNPTHSISANANATLDVQTALPHWDMTSIFPSLDSPEFAAAYNSAIQKIADLAVLWNSHKIGDDAPILEPFALAVVFEEVMARYSTLQEELRTVGAYIGSFISTNSRDEAAQARRSGLQKHLVTLSKLGTRMATWIGTLDLETLFAHSETAKSYAHYLRRTQYSAKHLMPVREEALLSELYQSGAGGWSKLYSDTVSQISIPFGEESLPMSAIRALASDSDRDTRRRAYEAELAAWEKNALPIAAALNAIKHESNAVFTRRGWDSPLEVSVFLNSIDKPTLDAMMSAAKKSFPHFRTYLKAKAKILFGGDALPWFDLFAPVGSEERHWDWPDATAFVAEQFGTYSPKMQNLALRAYREKWIDAEPRMGKHDGAFCMGIRKDESRIGQNYKPAYGGVSTLAHELGHAYHNICLADRPYVLRGSPMTLAETASIFCETIVRRAAMKQGSAGERLAILEASLQSCTQTVVDITSRFLFESRVLEARKERELSIAELCTLMAEAQKETYGDGLDSDALHPYMWAAKGHYYGSTFYNYPYMFGLLFSLGLFAKYESDPDTFRTGYDDLLSRTGMADAATLAAQWGIDTRDEAFWDSSLAVLRADIAEFVQLTALA